MFLGLRNPLLWAMLLAPLVADANDGPVVAQDSDLVLRYQGSVADAAGAVASAVVALDGKIKAKEDDRVEARWPYGANGLFVTVKLTELDDSVQIVFRGHFKTAFDTFGAANRKALQVVSATKAELESPQ